ncbi:hypothetical protein Zmor_009203 [Zophobas morio]|uniref:4-nitrophenylphosphatase n=1 Tax=Zophobas morio TaxID=2755281 RepID=A0AA38MI53_9CUCU|nr:hypothetical protein Zmor_009203 [Zophobas morio]
MKDLSTLTVPELEDFFSSFDHVLTDIDGVVWNLLHGIPGANHALKSLENLNKQIIFISNNTTRSADALETRLKAEGFDLQTINHVSPAPAMIDYLQKQNFTKTNKRIFVIGMTPLRQALIEAGFKLAENGPDRVKESVAEYASLCIAEDDSVGAVIADIDINLNSVNMQKALTFLLRKDVLFLSGAPDMKYPLDKERFLIGPGAFVTILELTSGRKPISMAKPNTNLHDFVAEKYKIGDPSRVLFVGDTVLEDMAFAANCGYKKLLVFSGLSNRSCVEEWTFPEEYKPDFYAESLKSVHEAVLRVFGQKDSSK